MTEELMPMLHKIANDLVEIKVTLAALTSMQKAYITQQLGFTPEQFEQIYQEKLTEYQKKIRADSE